MTTRLATPVLLAALLVFAAGDRVIAAEPQTPPVPQNRPGAAEATIRAEVAKTFDGFKSAVERVDLAAVLAVAAEIPEFRYTTAEGTVLDLAGWKQGHIDYFPTVTAHRFFPKSQEIAVLGPEAALVSWTGAMEIVPKGGPVQRVAPFSGTFVFKRIGDAWKLALQHESCPTAKAAVPAAETEAQLRASDTELVVAANARDLTVFENNELRVTHRELAEFATDGSTIRTEVIQTIQGMIAAEERFDAAAVWAVHADVPGYRWVDPSGTVYDFAGTKEVWTDFLAGCTQLKYTTLKEDVLVLARDLAFYTWTGSADVTPKNGSRTRHELWTARYLCRRIDGAWKITGGQESSAPGKVVGAATAEQARAAFEAYLEFWNKHNATALARAFSPALIYHYNGTVVGGTPADHFVALKEFGGAFPDLVGRIDHFAFSDGIGAASTTWIGTHQGTLSGIPATDGKPVPPTGRQVSISTNYLFRVEAGLIVELWETWDEGGFYQQLLQPRAAAGHQ